jgi:2,4-dienoyl-CoA reductase-like NADH-dependent reductase (Old Yellow Enzyme family)
MILARGLTAVRLALNHHMTKTSHCKGPIMSRLPHLFEKPSFRSVALRNRIVVAPMCQYSAVDGVVNDWHVQHLGARAVGGAGLVFVEATAVEPAGRITHGCPILETDEQQAAMARLVKAIEMGGAVPGIQLAHAGRKGSHQLPWQGGMALGPDESPWPTASASALPFHANGPVPHAMSVEEIRILVGKFREAARRSLAAGFKVIELHGAHGYLGHQFLSPLSNKRTDQYGGNLPNRARFLLEVVDAVREVWPEELPLFVRLSCVDYMADGLTIADTVEVAKLLKATGKVDLIDCSSGGILAQGPVIPSLHPGYQVPFADAVRHGAGIASGAVGLITTAEHAEEILGNGRADLIFIARAILADPIWPLRAAQTLGAPMDIAPQYLRAAWGKR